MDGASTEEDVGMARHLYGAPWCGMYGRGYLVGCLLLQPNAAKCPAAPLILL